MDYHINKEGFVANETILDEIKEQPIDVDFSLPDYCPNIQQILKCRVSPKINSRNILSDRLEIEGIAQISVLYLDADTPVLRVCEHSMPFTCSFALKGVYSQNALIFTNTKTEYVNCRAVSSRRLDIHGAFSISARVLDKKDSEVTCNIDGENIEQKKSIIKISDVIASDMEQFAIEESIEAGPSNQDISCIVKSEVDASFLEYKVVSDKVIIKGEAILKILYICNAETGELKTAEYSLSVSQILNISGAIEGASSEVSLDVLSFNVSERTDPAEGTFLDLEINLCASATVYQEKEISVVEDVYSIDHELESNFEEKIALKFHSYMNETCSNKTSFEFQDRSISSVLDVWNDIISINTKKEENSLELKGKMNICFLARDSEENLFYVERLIDFKHSCQIDENLKEVFLRPKAKINSFAYRIIDVNTLELKFDIKFLSSIYSVQKIKTISEIIVDEENKKEIETAALTIYYADSGEEIWEIAKSHNTSQKEIKIQNDLDMDVLKEDAMLLIPIV